MQAFNYIYVEETTLQPWGVHTNVWTYSNGDAPLAKSELNALAKEMAEQLLHEKATKMARIKLFHSERGTLAEATVTLHSTDAG